MDASDSSVPTARCVLYRDVAMLLIAVWVVADYVPEPDETAWRSWLVGKGLREVDRYLRPLRGVSETCAVTRMGDGVAFDMPGVRIVADSSVEQSQRWRSVASERGAVTVVFVDRLPATSEYAAIARTLSQTKRPALAVSARFRSVSVSDRYALLSVRSSEPVRGADASRSSILLDANVLVDMDQVASGWRAADSAIGNQLHDLVAHFPHRHLVGAFAIAELAFDRDAGWQHQRVAELKSSLVAWQTAASRSHAVSVGDIRAIRERELAARSSQVLDLPAGDALQERTYVSLLKLMVLWQEQVGRYSAKARFAAYCEYLDFVNSVLRMAMAYPMQVAFDRLLGPPSKVDYVNRLLKFDAKEVLSNTWGAAWDLAHLMRVDLGLGNFLHHTDDAPALLTADKGLVGLRSRLRLAARVADGQATLGFVHRDIQIDPRAEDWTARVAAKHEEYDASVYARREQHSYRYVDLGPIRRELESVLLGTSRI